VELGKSTLESMGLNRTFWRRKRVLLTGHTGFKGTWLALWLHRLGAEVAGIALPPATNPNLFDHINLSKDITSCFIDIRNLPLLRKEIDKREPEIVFHLAAQAIVRSSYTNPIETFETNVIGTANVLEALRSVKSVRAIICVTSDKCYENREWHWKYRENDPMGGWDPYSSSKGCAELVIASYRNSFFHTEKYREHGVGLASVRAGNVVGGGDWGTDRLIPDIMTAFSRGNDVVIRNPSAVRPWQFVIDLLYGYMLLAEKLYENGSDFAEAWNFGPNDEDEKTVLDIVKFLVNSWGDGVAWKLDSRLNPHEAFSLMLDSSKSRARLGWSPKMKLDQVLTQVVEWYKSYYSDPTAARSITERQLDLYENKYLYNVSPEDAG
jgi:CDP-glucose 4,6-dehydratase